MRRRCAKPSTQEGYKTTLFAFRPDKLDDRSENVYFYHYGIQDAFDIESYLRSRKLLRGHDFALRAAYRIKRQGFPLLYFHVGYWRQCGQRLMGYFNHL